MKEGIVVPHTHWDREWYQPFQGFRGRLVAMVDDLIEVLESDPRFEYFFFDGQTIVLQDYLEVRPDMRERLGDLIAEGRIGVGPWYDMPDEFLVSGEALVRNLMKGVRMAESFGAEAVRCGYVCDLFGHDSQLPQILRGFDISSAVIARGFADNSTPAELHWQSPDGSSVLTAKLDAERSYSDFYFAIRWPFDDREYDEDELVERMERHLGHKDGMQASPFYLLLEGVDHIEVEPKLPWILDVLNRRFDDVAFRIGSLEEYFAALAGYESENGALPTIRGEQIEPGRRGVNNQVLSNVWSSRFDLKRRNDACQELIEQWAEPLSVYLAWDGLRAGVDAPAGEPSPAFEERAAAADPSTTSAGAYPAGFLNVAWEYLLKNHPHDSICGCSIGQVHRDMHYRFDQCELIASDVTDRALGVLAGSIDTRSLPGDRSVTLFNNSDLDEERVYIFELAFGEDEPWRNIALYNARGERIPYQRLSERREIKKVHRMRRLIQFWPLRYLKVAARVRVPARGYTTLSYEIVEPTPLEHGDYTLERWVEPIRYPGSMRTGETTVDNGVLSVSIDETGHLSVIHAASGHRFDRLLAIEDGGEIGDGWNYRPPLTDTVVTSRGAAADVSIVHDGPHCASFQVRYDLMVPRCIDGDGTRRSADRVALEVCHLVTVFAGSPLIEVSTRIENTADDHIVRVLFPCGLETDRFTTDTPFDLVDRSFERPDRSDYVEPDTGVHPSQGFMRVADAAGGFAVFTRGLYEYQARTDEMKTLALTLMRCFSKEVATHGGTDGQLRGTQTFEYALRFFSPEESGLYSEYRAYKAGIRQTHSLHHSGSRPVEAWYFRHENRVIIVSALKRSEEEVGGWILRVWNSTSAEQRDTFQFSLPVRSVRSVNLNERPADGVSIDHHDSTITLDLPPKKVVTLELNL